MYVHVGERFNLTTNGNLLVTCMLISLASCHGGFFPYFVSSRVARKIGRVVRKCPQNLPVYCYQVISANNRRVFHERSEALRYTNPPVKFLLAHPGNCAHTCT